MNPESEPGYPIMAGVEMRPGVSVFCHDRDTPVYDASGVIASATQLGNTWTFGVVFNQRDGTPNPPYNLDASQIWPDQEEQQKEGAKQRRAERELRVFLCHGSEDKPVVRDLYQKIKACGMQPWLDEVDIEPGADWDIAIRNAVRNSHILLAVLSKKSTGKTGYVQKEIRFALDRAEEMPEGLVFIIPTLVEDCEIPSRLARWQAVRLNLPGADQKLLAALRKRAAEVSRDS